MADNLCRIQFEKYYDLIFGIKRRRIRGSGNVIIFNKYRITYLIE
jgi:hypothetical protein